ncbi:hypothetical protein [uncultured Mediterranean phage uvMED]|nr:hypothetical protein [uncultured Mediterranean phage uvMED]BAQ87245.1 hypothetical protein [uncultured Mediterranean phage uvMED]BAQ87316.1 hypothetical protein [uncultured Mediterranean phage uvMED]BAQ87354.1 hypothetical protein [uncultured Mediterranean phage uvMED]|tara:strand:+ start:128 stop:3229 length:3102 start_codon:yes stop_codon:yes gene_type:complete
MATISIADNDARVQYTQAVTANSTTLTIDFPFFNLDDIKVIATTSAGVDTTLSRGSGTGTFAVSGTSVDDGYSGGSITLGDSYANTYTYTIYRDITASRTTDFATSGPFNISSLNTELDKIYAIIQQIETENNRALTLPSSDATASIILPPKASRLNKYLAFHETTGLAVVGGNVTDTGTVASQSANISTLAGINANITTVAGISSNVTTVAGISSNVTTVAGIQANVTTVAGANSNVTTVANNIASVNTVATDIAKVIVVANDLNEAVSEIETAALDLQETTSEIDVVANNIANVNTVGGISGNVTTVAGIQANVTTLATGTTGGNANLTQINAVADNLTNVNAVATNATNINAVNSNSSNINTVAGDTTEINAVAGNATNINAVATNATNINNLNGSGVISNIGTVSGISSNVTTVAGIHGNVTTVAGIASDVTAVANDATDIGAVAGKATEIGRLGTTDAVADMALLGVQAVVDDMAILGASGVVGHIATVSGISSNVSTVAGIQANVTTVAGISSNVSTVAGISSNVTTVAGDSTEITAVAGNSTNINAVAGNATNINAVASNSTNINAVNSNATNINSVAGAISNVNTVGGAISNVNTVATNLSSINDFADKYRIGSSDPGSSNDEGDLFYNTTSNTLKVYTGSAWEAGVTAGSGFAALTGANFTGNISITSTDDGDVDDPSLVLYRNSASPADYDDMGEIIFRGRNDNSQDVNYARMWVEPYDVSDGTEGGRLHLNSMVGGVEKSIFATGWGYVYFDQNIFLNTGKLIKFEGASNDAHETTLTVADPTADRTITLPDATGTVLVQDSTNDVTITSTDATANADPALTLFRNSASPADNDVLGNLVYRGRNDNSQNLTYGQIYTKASDVSDGSEDAMMVFSVMRNGSLDGAISLGNHIFLQQTVNLQSNNIIQVGTLSFEGSTEDAYETTIDVVDPTADRTITLPNTTGTVITTGNTSDITSVGTLTSATVNGNAKADSFSIDHASNDWNFELSGADLVIKNGSTTLFKLDTSGNLTVAGDITTDGSL